MGLFSYNMWVFLACWLLVVLLLALGVIASVWLYEFTNRIKEVETDD